MHECAANVPENTADRSVEALAGDAEVSGVGADATRVPDDVGRLKWVLGHSSWSCVNGP